MTTGDIAVVLLGMECFFTAADRADIYGRAGNTNLPFQIKQLRACSLPVSYSPEVDLDCGME